ncbi:Aldo/keto reductase [Candidatus Koribacter versatilis Ellin345]|uniref:Aldo/keto reductase n=1 Tax=Koribacter versatilis (strain Ellin345) TaxID=204669 RepID=Q1IKE6_KORVE|nr:aldo/keto reductase [Candidatus Koribacter versatilis]ABF42654.1 Aldo/keto reductase [Candidatus Koribacter versatilis Ellin345]
MSSDFDRRSFLKSAAIIGAGSIVPGKMTAMAQNTNSEKRSGGAIPRRKLGKTGIEVSALGMGGYHLGSAKTQKDAVEMVARAIDAGITFFDNAWDYHDGQSEEYLGSALKGKRQQVVVMTKVCTHGRDKNVAMQQLEQSLRRLQTDHLDVWQIHEVIYDNDPDLIFRPDGAIEALTLAKQQGKVRAVGFTGHKDPRIHLAMLAHNFPFDTIQMPLNCLDATFRSFEQHVLPEAQKRGIAVLGMKSMGGSGEIVTHGATRPDEALRYAMSLPVATTISGMESMEVLEQNIGIASGFQPMAANEMQSLRDQVKYWAADGRFERFKTTKMYDGAEGRKQHEYPPTSELPA